MSTRGTEPAYVFEDRQSPGDWHVQWTDDDGGFEMAIFSGPRTRERAIMFAERCYGSYAELRSLTRVSGRPVTGSEAEGPRTALIGYEHPQISAG